MSPDMVKYVWIAASGLGVLVAAGVLWLVLKKVMSNGPNLFSGRDRRRLGLVEWTSIGGGRQLLLVRRDNIEHLILTGGPLDVVVESGIGKERPVEAPYQANPRPRSDLVRFEQSNFVEPRGADLLASDLPASRSSDHKRENGSLLLSEAEVVDGTILMGFSKNEPGDGSSGKAASEQSK
jgi:flagellar protein FliO/FliZ